MGVLDGKQVLFLSPAFFNYENKIMEKMKEMGASVDYYDERSISSGFARALLKISPSFFSWNTKCYYDNILSCNCNKKYDYIFIINCDMLSENILMKIKTIFPNANLCLYLWDSVNNIKGVTKKFKYFDRAFSFDFRDVEMYPELQFRPLFYADEFMRNIHTDKDYKYDVSFCGTIHSDRYAVIRKILDECKQNGYHSYLFCYLQSRFIYYFYKLVKKEFRNVSKSDFSFIKKSGKEIADIVGASRVIVDVQHPMQSGLTIRTIEMLGMHKKLITTNADIKAYDFYNPENIMIIDRKTMVHIPEEFIKSPYVEVDKKTYYKYSLEAWIEDVLVNKRS